MLSTQRSNRFPMRPARASRSSKLIALAFVGIMNATVLLAPLATAQTPAVPSGEWTPYNAHTGGTNACGSRGWGNGMDREPNTYEDLASGYMWSGPDCDPNSAETRAYLDAFLIQRGMGDYSTRYSGNAAAQYQIYAFFGKWKDCNKDGFIGSMNLGLEYPAAALLNGDVCPAGHPHNDGLVVREFIWFVPNEFAQPNALTPSEMKAGPARVWADFGGPSDPYTPQRNQLLPIPEHAMNDVGGGVNYAAGIAGWDADAPEGIHNPAGPYAGHAYDREFQPDTPPGPSQRPDGTACERTLQPYGTLPSLQFDDASPYRLVPYVTVIPTLTAYNATARQCVESLTHDDAPELNQPACPTCPRAGKETAADRRIDPLALTRPDVKRSPDFLLRYYSSGQSYGRRTGLEDATGGWDPTVGASPGWLDPAHGGAPVCGADVCRGWMSDVFYLSAPYVDTGAQAIVDSSKPWTPSARPTESTMITTYGYYSHAWTWVNAPGHAGTYGSAQCESMSSGVRNGWDCDWESWRGPVKYGQPFLLRDVDRVNYVYAEVDDDEMRDSNGNRMGDAWENEYFRGAVDRLSDPDGDCVTVFGEWAWDLLPVRDGLNLAPLVNYADADMDGMTDAQEIWYWNSLETDEFNYFFSEHCATLPKHGYYLNAGRGLPSGIPGVAARDPDHENLDTNRDGKRNIHDADSDGDGFSDGDEYNTYGTFPEFQDSDCPNPQAWCKPSRETRRHDPDRPHNLGQGDGIPDKEELDMWDALGPTAWVTDFDGDGIANNLLDPDADGDGLLDGDEHKCRVPYGGALRCTRPWDVDSDRDGLLDGDDIIVPITDARYHDFANQGIVYRQEQDTVRRFLGERSQGTDPANPDTDGDGRLDGEEAWGTHPARTVGDELGLATDDPRNENLENLLPFAKHWLANDMADARDTTTARINDMWNDVEHRTRCMWDAPPGNDPDAFKTCVIDETNQTIMQTVPEAMENALPGDWTEVADGVRQTGACIDAAARDPHPTSNPVPATQAHADCLVGAVKTVADATLAKIETIIDEATTDPVGLVQSLDPVGITRDVPDLPILDQLPLKRILNDPADTSWMPEPASPWSPTSVEDTPVERILWNDIPHPRLTATALADLTGDHTLFNLIALADAVVGSADEATKAPAGVEVIATLDAGAYNLAIYDGQGRLVGKPRTNNPIGGVTLIDLDDDKNTGAHGGAELLVRAQWSARADGTQTPRVTVERLVDMPLPISVVVFMQVPNAPYILGMGVDGTPERTGTPDGLPRSVDVTLGANPLTHALGSDPTYTFAATTSDPGKPLHLVAAYFHYTQRGAYKDPDMDNRADLVFKTPRAPSTVQAELTQLASRGGIEARWLASDTIDADLLARWTTRQSASALHAQANALPRFMHVTYAKDATGASAAYRADAQAAALALSWTHEGPARANGGTFTMRDVPTSLEASIREADGAVSFTSAQPLGEMLLAAFDKPSHQTTAPECRLVASAQYVTYVRGKSGDACATARLVGLKSLAFSSTSAVALSAERAGEVPRIVVNVEADARVFVDVAPWPASIDVSLSNASRSVQLSSRLSSGLASLGLRYENAGTTLSILASGVPPVLLATADPTTRTLAVQAQGGALEDVALRYASHAIPLPGVGGDDVDGVNLVLADGALRGLGLRLREFTSATLRASTTTGLDFNAVTASTHRFRFRWTDTPTDATSPPTWLSVDFPRLLRDVRVSYTKLANQFTFTYQADEIISNADGYVKLSDGGSAVLVKLEQFPRTFTATADFAARRIQATTSSTVAFAEVALAGPDGAIDDVVTENYVKIDRTQTVRVGGVTLPTFHVRLTGFDHATVNFTDTGLTMTSAFATPGSLSVRYLGGEEWIRATLGPVPPMMRIQLDGASAMWQTTPGAAVVTSGAAKLGTFHGEWEARGLPAGLWANWTQSTGVHEASLEHTGADVELLDVTARIRLPGATAPAIVHARVEDAPARVRITAAAATSTFDFRASNADGTPRAARVVEAAYASRADDGLPKAGAVQGGVAYARLASDGLSEFYGRLPGAARAGLRATPDPAEAGRMWVRYEGTGGPRITLDVEGDDGRAVRGHFASLPTELVARLYHDPGTPNYYNLTYEAAGAVSDYEIEIQDASRAFRVGGSLPTKLTAASDGNVVTFIASQPATVKLLAGAAGALKTPITPGDHVIVDLAGPVPFVSVELQGVRLVRAYSYAGIYHLTRAVNTDVRFGLGFKDGSSLYGSVTALAREARLTLNPASGYVTWTASERTGGIDIWAYAPGAPATETQPATPSKHWRVDATGIPTAFTIVANPTVRNALVEVRNGEAFGSVTAGYAGDGSRAIPRLDTQGFVADFSSAQGDAQRLKFAARLDGLKRIAATVTENQLTVTVDRAASGGAFAGHLRMPGSRIDLTVDNLPATTTVVLEKATPAGGLHVHVGAGTEPLGNARVSYDGGQPELLEATITNLPNSLDVTFTGNGDRFRLDYSTGTVASGTTGLRGHLRTRDWLEASFDITELPQKFHVEADLAANRLEYAAQKGALVGELLAQPQRSRVFTPPEGVNGASISTVPGNAHVWMKADGLTRLAFNAQTQPAGTSVVEMTHRAALDKPFYVTYESPDVRGHLQADDLPRSLTATVRFAADDVHVSYTASAASAGARVWTDLRGSASGYVDVSARPLPAQLSFTYNRPTEAGVFAKLTRGASPSAPTINVDVKAPGGLYVKGTLKGVPVDITADVDPTREGPDACMIDIRTSSALQGLQLEMGRGQAQRNAWTRALGAQGNWIGVRAVDATNPLVDVNLAGFNGAKLCHDREASAFKLEAGLGDMPNLRVRYDGKQQETFRLEASGVDAGTTTVDVTPSLVQYRAPGALDALAVAGSMTVDDFAFGRDLISFDVDATNVPSALTFKSQHEAQRGNVLVVEGLPDQTAHLGRLHVKFNLAPPLPRSGSTTPTPAPSTSPYWWLDVNANVADLELHLFQNGHRERIEWAEHQIVFIDEDDRFQASLKLQGFGGARLGVVHVDTFADFVVESLRMRNAGTLHAYVDTGALLEARLWPAPADLGLRATIAWDVPYIPEQPGTFDPYLPDTVKQLRTYLRTGTHLDGVDVKVGEGRDARYGLELRGVGAGTTVDAHALASRVLDVKLDNNNVIEKVRFTHTSYTTPNTLFSLVMGDVLDVSIQVDMDGDMSYDGHPVLKAISVGLVEGARFFARAGEVATGFGMSVTSATDFLVTKTGGAVARWSAKSSAGFGPIVNPYLWFANGDKIWQANTCLLEGTCGTA